MKPVGYISLTSHQMQGPTGKFSNSDSSDTARNVSSYLSRDHAIANYTKASISCRRGRITAAKAGVKSRN